MFTTVHSIHSVFLLGIMLLLVSCKSDKPEETTEKTLTYIGEFETFRPSLFEHRIDTVQFTIIGQTYHLYHETRGTRICDSYGDLFAFGRPTVSLATASFVGLNCDSLRLPLGAFTARYWGDSVFLTREADSAAKDITYQFRLAPYTK